MPGGPVGRGVGTWLDYAGDYLATSRCVGGIPGVAVAVIGLPTTERLRQTLAVASAFGPLEASELKALTKRGKVPAEQWGPCAGPPHDRWLSFGVPTSEERPSSVSKDVSRALRIIPTFRQHSRKSGGVRWGSKSKSVSRQSTCPGIVLEYTGGKTRIAIPDGRASISAASNGPSISQVWAD